MLDSAQARRSVLRNWKRKTAGLRVWWQIFHRQCGIEGLCLGKLISPVSKRRAIVKAKEKYNVSERRACLLFSQHRGTQRYEHRHSEFNEKLTERIIELACSFGRYG